MAHEYTSQFEPGINSDGVQEFVSYNSVDSTEWRPNFVDENPRSSASCQASHAVNSTPTPRRLCAVCEGTATGYHYGVPSCEACKAFFKRTVQKNMSYSCTEDGQCEVFHGKRRTCQACRYDKCITVGMMVNGVRLNRCKGGRQDYRRKPDELDFAPTSTKKRQTKINPTTDFCQRLLDIEPTVLEMSLPYGQWGDEVLQPATNCGRTPIQKIWMELIAEVADRALTTTVQWAKKIPGFDKLCLNDQMALLCNSWMEIILANVIYRSSLLPQSENASSMIYFADGFIMMEEMAKGTERGPLIFNQIANVVDRLRELNVSRGIMVILKAIILFNSGPSLANRLTLQSPDTVHELQTTAYDSLHCRLHQEHPGDFRLVYRLLMVLPLIKDVAVTVATTVWTEFNNEQVFMQQLLREVVRPIIRTKMRTVTAGITKGRGGGTSDRDRTCDDDGSTPESMRCCAEPGTGEEERWSGCSN